MTANDKSFDIKEAVSTARQLLAQRHAAESAIWAGAIGALVEDCQPQMMVADSLLSFRGSSCQFEVLPSQIPHPLASATDARPCKVHSLRISEVRWASVASNREQRLSLHLRALPAKLCNPKEMEALLQAEGLWESVESLRVLPGRGGRLGCAVLNARQAAHVQKLAKFFHGRQFGSSTPVAVSFAPPISASGLRTEGRKTPAKVESSQDLAKAKQLGKSALDPDHPAKVLRCPDLAAADRLGVDSVRCRCPDGLQRVQTSPDLSAEQLDEPSLVPHHLPKVHTSPDLAAVRRSAEDVVAPAWQPSESETFRGLAARAWAYGAVCSDSSTASTDSPRGVASGSDLDGSQCEEGAQPGTWSLPEPPPGLEGYNWQ